MKFHRYLNCINFQIYQNVHSLLIVKDGKLVLEEYFPGYKFDYSGTDHLGDYTEFNRNTIHNQASVTKSVTSILVGIAMDQGFIKDVHEKALSFFPEYMNFNTGGREKITLEHLLTMSAGLDWNEGSYPYSDQRNDLIQMFYQNDPIRYVLTKPVVNEPGTNFYYNSGLTNVLGEVVRRATELRLDTFAERHLFTPLGITQFNWNYFSNNVVFASGDLKIRPRDMAKIGFLFINDGMWNGNQIISQEWITASKEAYISVDATWKYGYKWWLRTYSVNNQSIESFSARGW